MSQRRVLGSVVLTAAMVVTCATVVGAVGVVPPANPASNVWAAPAFSFTPHNERAYQVGKPLPGCWAWSPRGTITPRVTAKHCVPDELAATNRAQRAEGLGAIGLPRNYAALSPVDQMLVLTDIERVSRGEDPVLGVLALLNPYAQRAAGVESDPTLPDATLFPGETGAYASNFAAGVNALDANYAWMYTDGWGGKATINESCTSASDTGCWGHRDNILVNTSRVACASADCSYVMGGGYVHDGAHDGYSTFTEVFVQFVGATPTLSYSWQQALAAGAHP